MSEQRIILVDSSEAREAFAERLRMQGYAVSLVPEGAEGARLALADPPAAVVADLWMPGISGVQLCRLLRAEPATEHVPIVLRGVDQDRQSRFWAERAGAAAYVGRGRIGDLLRALTSAIAAAPPSSDFFTHLNGDESDVRDRIAANLDAALFESVVASEVRALSSCGTFARLFDLLSQFVTRVTHYRWMALYADSPVQMGLHTHPLGRDAAMQEARAILGGTDDTPVFMVEDEDAHEDARGPAPICQTIRLGSDVLGRIALAPRQPAHPKDAELVAIIARELGGPIRIARLVEESQRLATTDVLTGLMNRRALSEAFDREVARAHRHDQPLCALLLDVDLFKTINDQRGHHVGDIVLAALGRLLSRHTRKEDLVGRWGGEEFVIALTGSSHAGGMVAAERIRAAVAAMEIRVGNDLLPVTASLGLAMLAPGEGLAPLIDRADRAMYQAKSSGRNRVVGAPHVLPETLATTHVPLSREAAENGVTSQ